MTKLFWFVLVGTACRPSAPGTSAKEPVVIAPAPSTSSATAEPPSRPRTEEDIEATLRIDDHAGGKHFQGVWLERDDGARWVISYRADDWWLPFRDHRVRVQGVVYEPQGQAVMATHFRVKTLALTPGEEESQMTGLVEVHEELEYPGTFRDEVGEKGTKLEGEHMTVFVSDSGTQYWLANAVKGVVFDEPVIVRGREVKLSRFMARPGGEFLWVIESRKK
jgi:hypothetical protein